MFNLLKEYISLKIREASFQDILKQVEDENENEDENNPDDAQQGTKIGSETENFKLLSDMGEPHDPLKTIINNQKRSETK